MQVGLKTLPRYRDNRPTRPRPGAARRVCALGPQEHLAANTQSARRGGSVAAAQRGAAYAAHAPAARALPGPQKNC